MKRALTIFAAIFFISILTFSASAFAGGACCAVSGEEKKEALEKTEAAGQVQNAAVVESVVSPVKAS